MSVEGRYDRTLFCVTAALVALGLVMVMSASLAIAQERFSSPFFFFQRHAVRVALGMCLMLVFMRVPYSVYRRLAVWILAAAFALLLAIFPWGMKVRGSCRWLALPLVNVTIQPVEIAKIALVIFFAARLAGKRGGEMEFKRDFAPLAAVTVAMALLVALQPNFSNALFIVVLSVAMMFVGGCKLTHVVPFAAGLAGTAILVMSRFSHVQDRFDAFVHRAHDAQGINWHVNQSLIALGSGFIFGCGPGRGHQKYSFLPDAHTDFIYSIIGEEFGVIGTLLVLALFVVIFIRALRAAQRAPDSFGSLLALGLGFSITAAALLNMAMTLGIVPTAGLPLPLVSYGGTSILTAMASVGILLNVSAGTGGAPHRAVHGRSPRFTRRVHARRVGGSGRRWHR